MILEFTVFPDGHLFIYQHFLEPIIATSILSLIGSAPLADAWDAPCSNEEIRAARQRILASMHFARAHRCAALLTYLIEHAMAAPSSAPSEYDIGIAVFRRDRHSYHTGEDPIVRVQAGRLRQRLAAYYAAQGSQDPLRIVIPVGSYHALMRRLDNRPVAQNNRRFLALAFRPLVCLSQEAPAQTFTQGLHEELEFQLHSRLPNHLLIGAHGVAPGACILEGAVRQDDALVRVSLCLRHTDEGTILWRAQFDSGTDVSITAQEQLAERCAGAAIAALALQAP